VLEWLTDVPPQETRFPATDLARAALDSDLATGQIFFVNGKNSLPTRESTDPKPVMAIFGRTTEIVKDIIGRGLGLHPPHAAAHPPVSNSGPFQSGPGSSHATRSANSRSYSGLLGSRCGIQ
jgi:hypothetical protein